MKKIMLVMLLATTIVVSAQVSPSEVKQILIENEKGHMSVNTIENNIPAVENMAREVFITKNQSWYKKDRLALFQLAIELKVPSIIEISSIARYDIYPKISDLAWEIFNNMNDEKTQLVLDEIKSFQDSLEAILIRREIDEQLLAVNDAPWPIATILWNCYSPSVNLDDLKKVFCVSSATGIFAPALFDMATYMAINSYDGQKNDEYKEIVLLLINSREHEPKLVDKSLRKIEKVILQ